ncbi:hypothetical protein [Acidicapsa acidisoli]|uniref:hypothetical protein n=1 Tax=Acidicapsa acidisoli TaxID=1615681 RepID=UPI0021E02A01|nr:hypothetical protein [Acidicapsa acidisoli]
MSTLIKDTASRFLFLSFFCGVFTLAAISAYPQQQSDSMANMPGMNKDSMADMKDMGPSMAAMAGHMYVTPPRPRQPGDEEKVKAIVAQVRSSIERYRDYKKALADGYVIGNPEVDQPQSHFNSQANIQEAERHFDPTRPSSLLYFKTPKQHYKLEGVMFTASAYATEDELNDRIPLSVVRWHEHTNFCAAPADRVKEYFGQHPKFGMFGSINTAEACRAEGGVFYPHVFTWMIHVFPFEDNLKDVFSMNDDIPHFGLQP